MPRRSPFVPATLIAMACLSGGASADPTPAPAHAGAHWPAVLALIPQPLAQSRPGSLSPLHSAVRGEAFGVTSGVPLRARAGRH